MRLAALVGLALAGSVTVAYASANVENLEGRSTAVSGTTRGPVSVGASLDDGSRLSVSANSTVTLVYSTQCRVTLSAGSYVIGPSLCALPNAQALTPPSLLAPTSPLGPILVGGGIIAGGIVGITTNNNNSKNAGFPISN